MSMFLKRIMLENEQSSSHRPTPPDLQLEKSSRSSSKERREFFVYVLENYNRSAPWMEKFTISRIFRGIRRFTP